MPEADSNQVRVTMARKRGTALIVTERRAPRSFATGAYRVPPVFSTSFLPALRTALSLSQLFEGMVDGFHGFPLVSAEIVGAGSQFFLC